MEQLITKNFKLLYPTEQKLRKLGFRQMKNSDENLWKYTFSVYKFDQLSLIDCVLLVDMPSGDVKFNVYSNGSTYASFYDDSYGNSDIILKIINSNILQEFEKLNIREKRKKKCRK